MDSSNEARSESDLMDILAKVEMANESFKRGEMSQTEFEAYKAVALSSMHGLRPSSHSQDSNANKTYGNKESFENTIPRDAVRTEGSNNARKTANQPHAEEQMGKDQR